MNKNSVYLSINLKKIIGNIKSNSGDIQKKLLVGGFWDTV
jgi:hypothetical protein